VASLTHADLQTRIANRLRISTSHSAELTKLTALMNDAYRAVATAHPTWWWLEDRQIVNTVAELTTGTVAATNGSTTITFSDAPAATQAQKKILIDGDGQTALYRISTHTAGQASATLDAAYTGTTVTAAAFHVWKDEYDVAADTNRILSILRSGTSVPMRQVSGAEMDRLKMNDASEGPPRVYCLRNFDTSGDPTTQRQLVVHPFPDDTYRLEIAYIQSLNTEVSGSTRFLIPDDYVDILLHATLADGYPIFLNDTARGQVHRQRADALLARMIATQRTYDPAPTIQPAAGMYRGFYSRARRVTTSNADLGSYFDRWPSDR
jgi:hypothetical protein